MEVSIFNTDNNSYRIPAIVVTTSRTILAFCEARKWGVEDMGCSDIVMRRSKDNGVSWEPMQTAWSSGQVTCNPCPIVDTRTGRVHLLMTSIEDKWDEYDILAGRGHCEPFACYSDDDGITWSDPKEVGRDPSWRWYATGPGSGIQLKSGRLIAPCNHSLACPPDENHRDDIYHSHILYSDDGGESWLKGDSQPAYTNESTVVELNDGSLLHNMRHQVKNNRAVGISRDEGETWNSYHVEEYPKVPVCQGSLLRLCENVILFCCPSDIFNRYSQTVYKSVDECKSWEFFLELYEGSSGYSSMARLDDNNFVVLYERDSYNKIVFRHIELK